jgi:tRNA(Ile)-lysidine synthase
MAGDRTGVAVSGGTDSVALLRLLLEMRGELGVVLSVVHFNHKLRGVESDADEQFVADLARAFRLEFLSDNEDVAEHASQEGVSVEAAARELRYAFFGYLLASGANALHQSEAINRSGEGVAPPKDGSQGREPASFRSSSDRLERRALSRLDNIVTGHTLDDQAETVLMRTIRGTGVAGLGGIHPRIAVEDGDGELFGEILRPLLGTRRRELEHYLNDIDQGWREDATNSDHTFTRNRLRGIVIPLLEREFNPAVAENLAELAQIARGEDEYWQNEVAGWMGTAVHWLEPEWMHAKTALVRIFGTGSALSPSTDSDLQSRIDDAPWLVANASVSRPWFLSEPLAVQRRVVKAIGEHAGIALEFKHVEEILRFAAEQGNAGGELALPRGWKLVRHPEELLFVTPDLRKTKPPQDYEYEITVPGRTILPPEVAIVIEARCIPPDHLAEYNPDELLDSDSLPRPLRVRNWRAGDRFWPAHTKSPKKIKELLQERHVVQSDRALWPVIVSGNEIVWVRGFPAHAKYRGRPGHSGILISDETWPKGDET